MTKIAIFASGNGSNFEALTQACLTGEIPAHVALMVCDRPGAGVVARAQRLETPYIELSPKDFQSKSLYEQAIVDRLHSEGVDLICLAGYMRILTPTLLEPFQGKIVNIHPSLLPSFKGARAMEQAIDAGVKVYGATVHYVCLEVDSGAIIDQEAIRYEGSKIEELEPLIHAIEHPLYIRAVKKILEKNKKHNEKKSTNQR